MSLMIKINNGFSRNYNCGESDIYRKFSKQFDNLFNSEEMAKNDAEFEEIYVHDIDFESQIERFRTSHTHMAKFCVGYTGIGKSTSIRHCFGLGISKEAHINTNKKEIIFPTFLDGYQSYDIERFDLSSRIAAVCSELEQLHPELRQELKTYQGKKDFYDFMSSHTAYALENINPVTTMDLTIQELIVEKLNAAYKQSPFEYQANRLKYYIKKNYDKYERLIIILDDMETLPEEYQRETIAKYLKLYSCMQNTDYPDDHQYRVNLLISVRPHTYRLLNKSRRIEAFAISEPAILKNDSVDLEQIFINRFDYYTKITPNTIGNIETWNSCYTELMRMNQMFDGKYKEMIKNLCFLNVRESLASYAKIFANRFWVQKNKLRAESFRVDSHEYSFNNINVIRSLACNEESVFWGTGETIIPNIFYTTKKEDLSIHCLLVMQYFKAYHGDETYGLNARELVDIKKEWQQIFGEQNTKNFIKALEFLFENKILRKSIEDFDDIETLDTLRSLKDNSKLYISPRGMELLEMFKRDSVLLEMLRESSWRNYENREYSELSSYELMKVFKQNVIFIDLLEYLDYLCELEDNILTYVKKLRTNHMYKQIWGEVSILNGLLTGVKKSLEYSGLIAEFYVNQKYNHVNAKIQNNMNNF